MYVCVCVYVCRYPLRYWRDAGRQSTQTVAQDLLRERTRATHYYNTLPHTAAYCNTLTWRTAHSDRRRRSAPQKRACNTLQHTATHCNTLQHTTVHCNTLQHTQTVAEDLLRKRARDVDDQRLFVNLILFQHLNVVYLFVWRRNMCEFIRTFLVFVTLMLFQYLHVVYLFIKGTCMKISIYSHFLSTWCFSK